MPKRTSSQLNESEPRGSVFPNQNLTAYIEEKPVGHIFAHYSSNAQGNFNNSGVTLKQIVMKNGVKTAIKYTNNSKARKTRNNRNNNSNNNSSEVRGSVFPDQNLNAYIQEKPVGHIFVHYTSNAQGNFNNSGVKTKQIVMKNGVKTAINYRRNNSQIEYNNGTQPNQFGGRKRTRRNKTRKSRK
jgi:hypothetical protein